MLLMGSIKELITGEDLTRLEIVVRDDNEKSESFLDSRCQIRYLT